jgi:hypothetical protein
MRSEFLRYLATASPIAVAIVGGTFGLLRLRMRLRFNRYIVDRAVGQGQKIDATEIIKITTPRVSWHRVQSACAAIESEEGESKSP